MDGSEKLPSLSVFRSTRLYFGSGRNDSSGVISSNNLVPGNEEGEYVAYCPTESTAPTEDKAERVNRHRRGARWRRVQGSQVQRLRRAARRRRRAANGRRSGRRRVAGILGMLESIGGAGCAWDAPRRCFSALFLMVTCSADIASCRARHQAANPARAAN